MTPEETQAFQAHIEAAAAILFKNTPNEQLQDFESIERSVRDHMLASVSPQIGHFLRLARVSHSTQQRLVQRIAWRETKANESVETLSIDGGKVRLRTDKGQPSQWRDYKAVALHERVCGAWLQQNEALVSWVNQQPLAAVVTCVGDGHDGIWNLMGCITPSGHRREILGWYHLVENLYKVGGSLKRLRAVKTALWQGQIQPAQAAFADWRTPQVENFLSYLSKHRERIVDYQSYQEQGRCIGSGAVESAVKRIGLRLKLSGAQWKPENVAQVLKQRCAYLNQTIA